MQEQDKCSQIVGFTAVAAAIFMKNQTRKVNKNRNLLEYIAINDP